MASRDLSRRDLFRRFVPETVEHVGRDVREELGVPLVPRRRPPGAVGERAFLEKCTRCRRCVEACEHGAIHTLADWVAVGAGTPVMVPESRPCHTCDGFPCAQACDDGALLEVVDPVWKLGSARLVAAHCLVFQGPECGACAGLCPPPLDPPPLALTLGRPSIDPDSCVGCGLCIDACPVTPAAIEMIALD